MQHNTYTLPKLPSTEETEHFYSLQGEKMLIVKTREGGTQSFPVSFSTGNTNVDMLSFHTFVFTHTAFIN